MSVVAAVSLVRRHPHVQLLAQAPLRRVVLGALVANGGDGMALVAVPWLALQLAPEAGWGDGLAVSAAITATYATSVPAALWFGLTRRRFDPRRMLLADCVLRGGILLLVGALAALERLPLWALVALLGVATVLRTLAVSAQRLIATDLAGPDQRLATHSLMFTQLTLASYVLGPALGGLLTAAAGPAAVLVANGVAFVPLLVTAVRLPPEAGRHEQQTVAAEAADEQAPSGLEVLRRHPAVLGLLALTFLFDLAYMPVEVALPIHVEQALTGGADTLGGLWTAFGGGALAGSLVAGLLGHLPQRALLVGIVAGWALSLALVAAAGRPELAAVGLAAGGLVYAPFNPVAYTLVQGDLPGNAQQPALTVFMAVAVASAPLGLAVGGPLVASFGATGTLWVSAGATLTLAAVAAAAMLRPWQRHPRPVREPAP